MKSSLIALVATNFVQDTSSQVIFDENALNESDMKVLL
jgi:hypothetical protein